MDLVEPREVEVPTDTITIICDPKLTEGVVQLLLRQREQAGEMSLSKEYHRMSEEIYDRYPISERNDPTFDEEFETLNYKFFERRGFLDLIREALNEYPVIGEKVGEVVIKKTYIRDKAEANLAGRIISDDERGELKVINLTLSVDLFEDLPYLRKFLRHELMHVIDMLDESFGYEDTKLGESPAEELIIYRRYGAIWDTYINSRLIKMGKETTSDKDGCRIEFEGCYGGLPPKERLGCFEGIWQTERLTHRQILEMTRDVEKLREIAVAVSDEAMDEASKKKRVHLPGSICPMCRFPTHHWVDGEAIDKEVIDLILKDLPNWNPADGACERCVEVYKLRAGKW